MSTDPRKEKITVTINLPVVTEDYRRKASEIANCQLALETPDGPVSLMANEVTESDLRREAKRVAALPNENREDEVFKLLHSCIQVVSDAQNVAQVFLWIAQEIDAATKQLETVEKIVVHGVNRNAHDRN